MQLSVIVNHYQTPAVLKNCLKSLQAELATADFSWEIIVTDSATIEATTQMMQEEFPHITFLSSVENIGFGKSNNKAFQCAQGDLWFIINADIIVDEKGVIQKMMQYLNDNPFVGMLGPKLWNINDTWQQSCFRFYTPWTILLRRTWLGRTKFGKKHLANFLMQDVLSQGDINTPLTVDWLMGSALMVRKKDVEKIGGFDERYFMYFEDVDWARRFWENDLQVVYFPLVTMYHYHFQSSKKGGLGRALFNKYTRIHIESSFKYFKKFGYKSVRYGS